jgi:hypothetical protein
MSRSPTRKFPHGSSVGQKLSTIGYPWLVGADTSIGGSAIRPSVRQFKYKANQNPQIGTSVKIKTLSISPERFTVFPVLFQALLSKIPLIKQQWANFDEIERSLRSSRSIAPEAVRYRCWPDSYNWGLRKRRVTSAYVLRCRQQCTAPPYLPHPAKVSTVKSQPS